MPLSLVIISDTHGRHDSVQLPPGDVLIHCGDFSYNSSRDAMKAFLPWFNAQPHRYKILIAGNHDGALERHPREAREMLHVLAPTVTYLENSGCVIGGYKFWGSPYTPEFCNWHFNVPRGPAIAMIWDKIPPDTDVLITHGPLKNILDKSGFDLKDGNIHVGCEDLLKRIHEVRPKLHCFGHVHHSYGQIVLERTDRTRTTFINAATCDEAYQPTHKPVEFLLE